MTTTKERVEIGKDAEKALFHLEELYQSFEAMNKHLANLIDNLDKEQYESFHVFWHKWPDHEDLDELADFLVELKIKAKKGLNI